MDVDAEGNPVKPIDTGVACEKCGAPMAVKRGPRGPFLGCTAYPKCRSTKPLPEELKEKLAKEGGCRARRRRASPSMRRRTSNVRNATVR